MARVIVTLLIASACATPSTIAPSSAPTAQQILAEMTATYAHAASYADRGTITRSGTAGAIAFRTAFVRPGQLRFELFADQPARRVAIWSNGEITQVESALTAGRIDETTKLEMALGTQAGASEGASVIVPQLLVSGIAPLIPNDPTSVASEAIDGHDCWRVDGMLVGRSWSVWIDKRLHLVRRTTTPRASGVYVTIRYEPILDSASIAVEPIAVARKTVVEFSPPVWIGIQFDGTTTRVKQVISAGPSARAGLVAGDEIISIGGAAVTRSVEVIDHVRHTRPGAQLALKLKRNGTTVDVSVKPEPMPAIDKLARDALLDKPAPDFTLPVVNGIGSGALAAMANDVVVVDFWATWCKPCELMIPHLHDLQTKHGAKLHIVAISADEPQEIADYLTRHKINYTIARDADGKVNGAYLVGALPMTVVIAKGIVRFVGVGYGDERELDATIARVIAVP